MYPAMADGETKPVLPPGSFITCSSDDTIRIWNLSANMATNTIYRRNIYSEDLIKTLYVDSDLSHIKENLDASVNNGDKSEADKQQAVFDQGHNSMENIFASVLGRKVNPLVILNISYIPQAQGPSIRSLFAWKQLCKFKHYFKP